MKTHKIAKSQQTFAEINGISSIHKLSFNQRKILGLVICKLTQASIAKKLKVSPAYICQTIKKLESLNLIKKLETQRTREGVREYNNFYEIAPELKYKLQDDISVQFTPARVHNVLRKFKIVYQSGIPCLDKRISYQKSWTMRGGDRYKFWYPGKAGLPSVTLDLHPKTLVAYVDKGQFIAARSKEEAEKLAWYSLFQAKDLFIDQQASFGVKFEIENVGQQIGRSHCGFIFRTDGPYAQKETILPGKWIDKSVEKELGEGFAELETFTDIATPLEKGVMAMEKLPETIRAAMPEALKELEKIGPLTKEVHTVLAHIQGGQAVQNQIDQLTMMMAKTLEQQNKIIEILVKSGVKIE